MTTEREGRCSVMWVGNDLQIIDADPVIYLSDDLVRRFDDGYGHPAVSRDGDVLTFRGTNRTVVYVIGEYDPDTRSYRAEWPD